MYPTNDPAFGAPGASDGPATERKLKQPRAIFINGRFLTQRLSGVQRFARELVIALDARLRSFDNDGIRRQWVLLVPPGVKDDLGLRNIELRRVGWRGGHLWDQTWFFYAARNGISVSLANSGPVLHPRSLNIIHDAIAFRMPENLSRSFRVLHQSLGRLLALRSRIGTVSEFSRRELASALGIDASKVFVISNGCEHIGRVEPDESVRDRLGLGAKPYFLFVGSLAPNKNLARAIEAFASLTEGEHRLVIVGAPNARIFGASAQTSCSRVIFAGYLKDSEIAALYRHATALLFPSVYEGFGIPPLEAMAQGCPVLASDIPPVREVCGDAATYFDPLDVPSIAGALALAAGAAPAVPTLRRGVIKRCSRFSWSESAAKLMDAVDSLIAEDERLLPAAYPSAARASASSAHPAAQRSAMTTSWPSQS